MYTPLVSVIMPCYNAERHISYAIESIIAQTYPHWELIITNDCSTDNSLNIINHYIQQEPARIKCFTNSRNSGAAASRNNGIKRASGEYIALLDADDIWLPHKLEQHIAFITEKDCAISYTAYGFIDEHGQPMGKVYYPPPQADYHRLLRSNVIGASSVVVRADAMKANLFATDVFHEDYTSWLAIVKSCGTAYGLQEPLTMYRILQGSKSDNKLRSALGVYNIYRRHLKFSIPAALWYMLFYTYYGVKKYSLRS